MVNSYPQTIHSIYCIAILYVYMQGTYCVCETNDRSELEVQQGSRFMVHIPSTVCGIERIRQTTPLGACAHSGHCQILSRKVRPKNSPAAGGQRGTTGCVHCQCVCERVKERESNAYIMRCLAGKTQNTDCLEGNTLGTFCHLRQS